jgi:hypothetical protein
MWQHIPTLHTHQPNFSALCQYYAHHAHHYYFSVWCQNLVHTPAHQHFSARRPKLSAHTNIFSAGAQNLVRTPAHQHFSTRCQIFSVRSSTPLFFRAIPNFYLVHPHANIFLRNAKSHLSQYFHCATCNFSAPNCAHSPLCASIPREFCCRNWGFFLTFSPIHHRH